MTIEGRICISSPPDRHGLVAEVFFGNDQWAELYQENGNFILEIYPSQDGKDWQLGYYQVIDALIEAKKRLVGE